MAHPATTIYPIIRTTSKVDGTPYQDILDLIPGKPFGVQNTVSQDGLCVCIDDASGQDNWGLFVSQEPRLNELKFILPQAPSYVPNNAHRLSHAESVAIIETKGASGVVWSALDKVW